MPVCGDGYPVLSEPGTCSPLAQLVARNEKRWLRNIYGLSQGDRTAREVEPMARRDGLAARCAHSQPWQNAIAYLRLNADDGMADSPSARMQETVHNQLLDSVPDGVFTVDSEWRVTFFNRAAEQITGINRADAVGRRCCDVFRASYAKARAR